MSAMPPGPPSAAGGGPVDALLAASGCSALVVAGASSRDPDIAHFVGRAHLGECLLVLPAGAEPRLGYLTAMEREEAARTGLELLTPEELEPGKLHPVAGAEPPRGEVERWCSVLSRALELAGVSPGAVAVAGNALSGVMAEAWSRLASAGWRVVSGNGMVRRVRKSKSNWELEEARRAAAGVVDAMRGAAALLAAADVAGGQLRFGGQALTAGRLRREIRLRLAAHGLHEPKGNIVSAGRDAAVPHNQGSSERALRRGETVVIDLYPRDRVFADCTRTFCVGRPPEAVAAAHEAVLAALQAAHREARPGVLGWDLQANACRRLAAAGYRTLVTDPGTETGYVHGLGHGVGLEIHELPSFRKEAGPTGLLEAGDLLTLEPGLYDPTAGWGLRLEDLVYLGAEDNEVLTSLPYDLDPRAWDPGDSGPLSA